jgi:hypothetical protein
MRFVISTFHADASGSLPCLHVTLERLNELDVTRNRRDPFQSTYESLIRGDRARVESNGQSDVHRVVHGPPGRVRQRMRVLRQRPAWNGLYRDLADVCDELPPFFNSQLLAADLLPDRVGRFGEEQIRGDVRMRQREQASRRVAVNLGHEPFDDDTGVDDEDAHRVSRSSRMSTALSDCVEPRCRFSQRSDSRRVSARRLTLALRRTSWISACSERPWALAAAFNSFKTSSSRFLTNRFAIANGLFEAGITMIPEGGRLFSSTTTTVDSVGLDASVPAGFLYWLTKPFAVTVMA